MALSLTTLPMRWWGSSVVLCLVLLASPRASDGWSSDFPFMPRREASSRTALFSSEAAQDTSTRTLEVCLSPGCVADGAEDVLKKLRALEVSGETNAIVEEGVCCSLCGNGPVALETESASGKTKKHRRIDSNKKIMDLLSLEQPNPHQEAVLEGIDWCLEGDQELQKKRYGEAIEKFGKGIEIGMDAAIALGSSDSNEDNDETRKTGASLQWVVDALCGEATARMLHTKDTESAIASAQRALELSGKKPSTRALEILQEAHKIRGEDALELEALEALVVRYEAEEKEAVKTRRKKRISPMEANKRRTLGFRLATLRATAPSPS